MVIEGRWRRWNTNSGGNCLNVHILEKGSGAGLFRSAAGVLLLAITKQVEVGLFEFIWQLVDAAKKKYGINVAEVQSSHVEMINIDTAKYKKTQENIFIDRLVEGTSVVSLRRVHPAINHATICLAFNKIDGGETLSRRKLSLPVRCSLTGDIEGLQVFCTAGGKEMPTAFTGKARDDSDIPTGIG